MDKKHPQVQITIQEDGSVTTDFSLFIGPDCLVAGQQLHRLLAELGIETEVTGMTPKPELLAPSAKPQALIQEHVLQEGEQA